MTEKSESEVKTSNNAPEGFKSGFVAIVGRPNVGKSTLLNKLVGSKVAITARKPQTTRHRISGVVTNDEAQRIFVDTPGIHSKANKALNKQLNKTALSVLNDVDVILFVVAGTHWQDDDQLVLEQLSSIKTPVIALVNKVDLVSDKQALLPTLSSLTERGLFSAVIPVSAKKDKVFESLFTEIDKHLPEGPLLYGAEQVTDRSDRFRIAETVREKLFRTLGDELPYGISVEITMSGFKNKKQHVECTIWVEATRHKAIVIGEKGGVLKQVGIDARKDLEQIFGRAFVLKLWVKVKENWSDDLKALKSLGYIEE